ncbi:hypothetical protein NDU88_009409 [Pleurodeles waltl]|uniref:Uncharacterized protein n=1 Tax=Pleurodeles waltl TaxID=8319 RepID=A0AAV7QXF6_PLEWA|nr:hypothetical protein NDU88_009409 [Pleurodeles waltl]
MPTSEQVRLCWCPCSGTLLLRRQPSLEVGLGSMRAAPPGGPTRFSWPACLCHRDAEPTRASGAETRAEAAFPTGAGGAVLVSLLCGPAPGVVQVGTAPYAPRLDQAAAWKGGQEINKYFF